MTLPLFDFPAAQPPQPRHMMRGAEVSDCGRYRWTLTRTWRAGPWVCFIGLNPSTADHETDDPTIRRWVHFAEAWGYGAFVAVNLYPFRSASVKDCRQWTTRDQVTVDRALLQNDGHIRNEAERAAMVVACWGAAAWDQNHVQGVVDWLQNPVENILDPGLPVFDLYCLGTTGSGAPKHPMARGRHRVPDDQRPILWRAKP